ncbi:esterase B1-like [Zerene cesonia]|uniref:esterase B1-like n=1 Tax=Zerene cesonia TaxID=33412 RepID=UPI0018E4EA60|nr:esterase B1-like [Zerene cesonia]
MPHIHSSGSVVLKYNESIIIGKRCHTVFGGKPYAAFYDIPYAEVPINELRFKPPILRSKWLCNKIYEFNHEKMKGNFIEDCLYLSIFMPMSTESAKLPVLVWLHENSVWQDPDFFIDEEILIVTVSFRTSIFGFLNTEDEFAEGNMGAKDILTALKWLHDNISLFNGDRKRITVAGAGIASTPVASMLISPAVKDLIRGAIIFDGSALSPSDYKNVNFEIANKLFTKLRGPFKKFNRKELYQSLNDSATEKLLSASQELFDSTEVRDNQRLINSFGCSLEVASRNNSFMKWTPVEMYRKKSVNNVPVIMGYTTLKTLYKLKGLVDNRNLLVYLNNNFQYLLPFEGKADEYESERYKKIKRRIIDFYFLNGTIGERSLRRYAKYLSDIDLYPLLRQAVLHSQISKCPVYLWRFALKGSLNIGWRSFVPNLNWAGATLDDEICYLFKCKSLNDVYSGLEANERDFIKKIVRLLANFIKHGNPTPYSKDDVLNNLQWLPLDGNGQLEALNCGRKRFKMMEIPEQQRFDFWNQLKHDFF